MVALAHSSCLRLRWPHMRWREREAGEEGGRRGVPLFFFLRFPSRVVLRRLEDFDLVAGVVCMCVHTGGDTSPNGRVQAILKQSSLAWRELWHLRLYVCVCVHLCISSVGACAFTAARSPHLLPGAHAHAHARTQARAHPCPRLVCPASGALVCRVGVRGLTNQLERTARSRLRCGEGKSTKKARLPSSLLQLGPGMVVQKLSSPSGKRLAATLVKTAGLTRTDCFVWERHLAVRPAALALHESPAGGDACRASVQRA